MSACQLGKSEEIRRLPDLLKESRAHEETIPAISTSILKLAK